MSKKQIKNDSIDVIKKDGMKNVYTLMGDSTKDKMNNYVYSVREYSKEELDATYQASDIFQRIVDIEPQEMTRAGFKIVDQDDKSKDYTQEIELFFEEFGLDDKIELGLKMARQYGGAALLIGCDDTEDPSKPLIDFGSFRYFTVLDKYIFYPVMQSQVDWNVTSPNYLKPKTYSYRPDAISQNLNMPVVHNSRVIRFEGVRVSTKNLSTYKYWGDSIYSRMWRSLVNFDSSFNVAGLIMQDVVRDVTKIKGLRMMVQSKGDQAVRDYFETMRLAKSVLRQEIVDSEDDTTRATTTLTGIPEILKMLKDRLVTATDMPHTVLFNESASGLGATGQSELANWYQNISRKQESILRPILRKLIDLYFQSRDSSTNGTVPKYNIEFNPLAVPSAKDVAEIQKLQAETDNIYLQNGTYDVDEIAPARMEQGVYSLPYQYDEKLRATLKSAKPEDDPEGE